MEGAPAPGGLHTIAARDLRCSLYDVLARGECVVGAQPANARNAVSGETSGGAFPLAPDAAPGIPESNPAHDASDSQSTMR